RRAPSSISGTKPSSRDGCHWRPPAKACSASASPSPTPARRPTSCAPTSPMTAAAGFDSTPTRTTSPAATRRPPALCGRASQGALEYAIRYMNERVIGGRPLADLQGLRWKIADMATQLDGARLLLYRAVAMAGSHGTPPALETAMAKTAANLAAKFVCDEAIQ